MTMKYKPLGIEILIVDYLHEVGEHTPVTMHQIAVACHVSSATVRRALKRLSLNQALRRQRVIHVGPDKRPHGWRWEYWNLPPKTFTRAKVFQSEIQD